MNSLHEKEFGQYRSWKKWKKDTPLWQGGKIEDERRGGENW